MNTANIIALISSPIEEDIIIAVNLIETENDLLEFLWIANILFFSKTWDEKKLSYYDDVLRRIDKERFSRRTVYNVDNFLGNLLDSDKNNNYEYKVDN